MEIRELAVPDCFVLDLVAHGDSRGRFVEWFKADALADAIGYRFAPVQANHSVSARGALRGVHYALVPPGQAKYVYCPTGEILDVIVDVRVGSPTFGVHESVRLGSEQPRAVFLAEGVGHAFLSLAPTSSATYLVSSPYAPEREFGIDPMDPELALPWPDGVDFEFSTKDRTAPSLAQARERGLLPTMEQCTARYAELLASARAKAPGR
ncbi:MAG: dTDP-4-dehydrorhamnose 3,5-epimerase, partial [Actinomycetota bacterium]|nr:dTDP-4-dehydrorhamnose 3,5-epimerase [Actinomycetota bacterium]